MKKLVILFISVLVLMSANAFAQKEDTCPERPEADKRAKRWAGRWFLKGEKAAKHDKFEKALDSFLCSLYLTPHENTVFNIAQLTNLVDDKATAAEQIKQFRSQNPGNEFDDELMDLVVSLETSLGIIEEEPLLPEPPPEEVEPEPVDSESEEDNAMAVAGYALLGTAGATLVAGIVVQALAGSAKNTASESTTYDEFSQEKDSMEKRQTGAIVLFAATGILAGTGALLVGLDKKKESEEGPEVSISPSPNGIVLSGSF